MPPPPVRAKTKAEPRGERVYGLSAALAVMQLRPEQVLSIAHTPAVRKAIADMLREAARRRIAYREVDDEELGRMAGTLHHEGVCLLARPRARPSLEELARRASPRGVIVALDGVGNPHNVGAVLRSAAFFGASGMIVTGEREGSVLTPPAVRVAEGGAERVALLQVEALPPALRSLRDAGMRVVGSDVRAATALSKLRWSERSVLVLGSEDRGLSAAVRGCCDDLVRIEGSGAIESLNVSVAAGVLLASYSGRRG